MKRILASTIFLFLSFGILAQGQDVNILNQLRIDALVLNSDGISQASENGFLSQINTSKVSYTSEFQTRVNDKLFYEIGELSIDQDTYSVMFIKNKEEHDGEIEFLVVYKESNVEKDNKSLKKRREDWMRLCNAHKAGELVKDLYTANAYYYNRGRLIQGTAAISQEYSYMNMPNYSLKLTPKHIEFVNENIAYEIGQCSGSYPLPYMLLWEKQADGTWQVLMDSNY